VDTARRFGYQKDDSLAYMGRMIEIKDDSLAYMGRMIEIVGVEYFRQQTH
jgi:hypothetical protein